MMRRLLLSSAKPHQPHQNHHHYHENQPHCHDNGHDNPQKVSPNTKVRKSKEQQVPQKPSFRASKGFRRRSLTRTRSASDMIREMANGKGKKKFFSAADSDDESIHSVPSEAESQHATSLRSFTKEDEERYAVASWKNALPWKVFSKIGEEDEQSNTPSYTQRSTSHYEEEAGDETENNPAAICSGNSSTKPSTASPSPDPSELSAQEPELKNVNAPIAASPSMDEDARTQQGSESENEESSSSATELDGSGVDAEYLLHENDLLRNSLEHVTQDRDYLALDNWNLRMELENLRNQMRFLTTASGISSPAYNITPQVVYRSRSPSSSFADSRHMNLAQPQDFVVYAQYGAPCPQTFEELMHETGR